MEHMDKSARLRCGGLVRFIQFLAAPWIVLVLVRLEVPRDLAHEASSGVVVFTKALLSDVKVISSQGQTEWRVDWGRLGP
jgi:hypothetical protein